MGGVRRKKGIHVIIREMWINAQHCSWEHMNIYLLNPGRKPTTDQSDNTTKVQLSEAMTLLGVFKGVLVRGYLKEHGNPETAVSPKAHSSVGEDL